MVAYTTAKGLYQVANSSYVGTWDVPENSNWGVVDAALGQITTVQLNNSPVTLNTAQVQSAQIIFSSSAAPGGNLAGSVVITFPIVNPGGTANTGPYIIQNLCGNSSLYTVTLQTTVAGGKVIACKPGEPFDVISDGINFMFKNMQHIGAYWDYAGATFPNWVAACTVPPYLNCDGTSFSSATYPALASIIGTILPDSKGRSRFTLNQGSGRITSSGGLDGNTNFAGGGAQINTTTLSSQNIPLVPITDPGHHHNEGTGSGGGGGELVFGTNIGVAAGGANTNVITSSAFTGITAGSSTPTAVPVAVVPPGYVGGLTLIRSA